MERKSLSIETSLFKIFRMNDYPLAAEKMKVNKDVLSPYCKNIQEKYGIGFEQVAKLIPTLAGKKNHVLHYRNLQLYLSLVV